MRLRYFNHTTNIAVLVIHIWVNYISNTRALYVVFKK